MIQVLDGLGDEDRFVILGQAGLKDGTTVRVVNEPASPQEEGAESPVTENDNAEPENGDATTDQ